MVAVTLEGPDAIAHEMAVDEAIGRQGVEVQARSRELGGLFGSRVTAGLLALVREPFRPGIYSE